MAINPSLDMERTLRKRGYGRHPYLQPRENGETEFVIDEPMIHRFIEFRNEHTIVNGCRNIGLFSSDDELIGKEFSKRHAATLEALGWQIMWSDKFGHRCNDQAVKVLVKALEEQP